MRKLGRCGRARQKRARIKSVSHSHQDIFVELQRWMLKTSPKWSQNSCKVLEPALFEGTGRGLRTRVRIKPGDTIVSIPAECLITTDTVLASPVGALIQRRRLQFTPQQLLSMFLIFERQKGAQSKWAPYLDTLPTTYGTPLYFSRSELSLLVSSVQEMAESSCRRFRSACEKIMSFVKGDMSGQLPIFTVTDLRWAWSAVNTRSVYLRTHPHPAVLLDPQESHMALAPFLDLLNHTDSAQITAGLNERSGAYEIVTRDGYFKYQQVFICYGPHDNAKLLIDYGFTLPVNYNNSVTFTLEDIVSIISTTSVTSLSSRVELERKMNLIRESQLSKQLVCGQDGCSWSLMTSLKIFCLPREQLEQWRRLLQGQVVSEDNERVSGDLAVALVTRALHEARRRLKHVESEPAGVHHDSLTRLAQDDVAVLQRSLEALHDR
ncbi:SET domain-containing protein 4 [Aplysia californica]|uniref:SET domain-containing protein 4 n=1 Tax=Aplysia californica TaxID=6500 RepID=A0ABM1VTB3_APLCA|nr:SET domain-containing protein 4 [Aplysia californica]XP_035825656.1 SET domain-containing protein 4 [Aplysia californica]XP_035825657.1 SET domain-containing protein 4 [Aplysia californica]